MKQRIKCIFGAHIWKRVSTQLNGVGFLDECQCCGVGRYLNYLGYASEAGKLAADQMSQWKANVTHRGENPATQHGDE